MKKKSGVRSKVPSHGLRQKPSDRRRFSKLRAGANGALLSQLRELQEIHRKLVDTPLFGTAILQDGKFRSVNKTFLRILGFRSLKELQEHDPRDLLLPQYRDPIFKQIDELLKGGRPPKRFDIKAIRKDGSIAELEVNSDYVLYEGKPALQASIHDVTKQNALLREVIETRDYLRNVVQFSGDGIITIDRNGAILSWNHGAEKIYGYPADDVMGRSLFEFDPPEVREERKRMFDRVWKGETLTNLELKRYRKDGQQIWVSTTLSPIKDASGNVIGMSAIVKDMTERKNLEQQIVDSEQRYRTLFEESKDMVFISDLKGRFIDVNPAGVAMFGYPSIEEMLKIDIARDIYVNPKDRKVFQDRMDRDGFVLNYVHELKKRDGTPIIVLETSTAVRDDAGRVIGYRGILRNITEQKKLEKSIRESEAKYRTLVEQSMDAISIGREGKYLFVNRSFLTLFGYTQADEVIGQDILRNVAQEDRQRLVELSAPGDGGEEPANRYEYTGVRSDGSLVEIEVLTARVDLEGQPATLSFHRDITERKRFERELVQRTHELEALDDINSALNESIVLEDILPSALHRIVSSQRYHVGALYTTRDDGTSLKPSSHVAYPGRLLDAFESLNLLEGITGLAAKTKQVVTLDTDDYPSYLPYRSLFEAEKIHSNAFVPLLSKGNVVGILHVGRKRPSLRTESDLRFLNSVASQLGVAIENAQLYKKMKESEERYRSVLESISDVVYKASSEGVMVLMSPNIDRLVGYRPSDFYQRKGLWLSLIHPDDRKSVDALAGLSFGEGQHRSIEYRVLPRGKAEYIWIRDSMSATKDSNGKVIEVYGIISAITERKKLEQEIRDSEQILRKVIDSMGDALIVTDLRGVIREVNREFERMTGSSRTETLGQEFPYKWTHEEEMARMVQWVNTLREKGYLHDFDLTMVNAKGEPVYTSLNTTLLRNEVGDPIAMLSIVRDITERKRLAEELRHRTRQIELLNRIISTANKSMNFEEIFSTITREVRELVPFDEINVSLLHPSRKSLEVYAIESNNPGATLKRGSTVPLEKSISRTAIKKGKAVVVPELSRYPKSLSYLEGLRSQISIPFYSKGEVLGAFNIASKSPRAYSGSEVQVLQPIADQIGAIVDRIRLFQKVSHDATYIHNLLDSMDNVVYTVDKESRIREVNKAWKDFATRSGMPELADERTVQGKQLLETVRERALKETYQNIIHEMLTGQTPYVSREISHEETGGERVYQMRVNPMLIENEITGLVFTNTDITDIKKTEAALRRRSEELLALNEIATLESTSLRLGPILGSVVPKIRQLLEADAVAVFLVGKDSGNIDLAEQEGLDEEGVRKIQRLPTQESATGLAISRGEPLFINERLVVNSSSQSTSHDLTAVREMRAFAAIPLHSKEKVLGALDVFYSKKKTFSRQDQQILLLLATQLASAIENALLYEQVSDQVKRLTVLYELSQKLTSSLKLGEISGIVHEKVTSIIPFDSFSIELYDINNQTIRRVFGVDRVNDEMVFLPNTLHTGRKEEHAASWRVATTRRSILEGLETARTDDATDQSARSCMYVPMLSKDAIIGIMSVRSNTSGAYMDTHLRLLESIANLTAIALEKASLYEETVRKSSEIQERNKELDDFTYVVSHDLKEPLVTIEGYSKILLKDLEAVVPSEGKEYLHTISDSCGRMKRLIDDLLMLSRLGRVTEVAGPVSIGQIIADIRADLEFSIEEKNASVTVQEDIPQVTCNETQIRIVFTNLIANALKFNRRSTPTVHIGYTADDENHHFYVQDNGIGIEEQYFEKIFSIFQRLHPNEDYEGTGAGLTIVKKIIENHRGRIWVESEVNQGSTFHFTLPRDISGGQWAS